MLTYLIFFFKKFSARGPIGSMSRTFTINRTVSVDLERG